MTDTRREDGPTDETTGAAPAGEPGTARAVAETVARMLANPRRTRRS